MALEPLMADFANKYAEIRIRLRVLEVVMFGDANGVTGVPIKSERFGSMSPYQLPLITFQASQERKLELLAKMATGEDVQVEVDPADLIRVVRKVDA
jgi:hypothetical protein